MAVMKIPKRVRVAAMAAALLVFPLTVLFGVTYDFHVGEWMAAFAGAAVLALVLVDVGL